MPPLRRAALGLAVALLAIPLLAAGDGGLLPADGAVAGWRTDGRAKVYQGTALYDHIDGGGEIFLELGFEACTVQRYRKGGGEITLELYRMADPAAAMAIYLMQCGKETPAEGFGERHTVGQTQIRLVKGKYFAVGTAPSLRPGLPGELVSMARAVAGALPASEPPSDLPVLPEEGLVASSVRIIRGPIGLQALTEGQIVRLRPGATAVAGDYSTAHKAWSLVVVRYASSAEAEASFKEMRAELPKSLSISPAGEGAFKLLGLEGGEARVTLDGNHIRVVYDMEAVGAP